MSAAELERTSKTDNIHNYEPTLEQRRRYNGRSGAFVAKKIKMKTPNIAYTDT
jgi:hypothetical protein